MKIDSNRFGTIEIDDEEALAFPNGIIGFPGEKSFILIRQSDNSPIGWLHSTKTGWLALPVVSVEALAIECDDLTSDSTLRGLGIDPNHSIAMMVVLNPSGPIGPTVNLVAPIVVNAETRQGAQVLIEGTEHSTQERLLLKPTKSATPQPSSVQTAPVQRTASHGHGHASPHPRVQRAVAEAF